MARLRQNFYASNAEEMTVRATFPVNTESSQEKISPLRSSDVLCGL